MMEAIFMILAGLACAFGALALVGLATHMLHKPRTGAALRRIGLPK